MIAVTFPGKIGDCLYTLPTIRALSNKFGKVDFYTSTYCVALKKLFEYQSCINSFNICTNYRIAHMNCGVQPWEMPVDYSKYNMVYHLGFRENPDRPLHKYIANLISIDIDDELYYELPDYDCKYTDYYVLSPGGKKEFRSQFTGIVALAYKPVLVIGKRDEYFGVGANFTGLDFIDTASIVSKSSGFIGTTSANLAIANAYDIPKVVLCNDTSGDMRHVLQSDKTHYISEFNVNKVLGLLRC